MSLIINLIIFLIRIPDDKLLKFLSTIVNSHSVNLASKNHSIKIKQNQQV